MKICRIFLITSFAIALTNEATAGRLLDSQKSDYGVAIIEENIANPKIPTHLVSLLPQEGSNSAGTLVFRCLEDQLEIFYNADRGNFFPFVSTPNVKTRFQTENKSTNISTSPSSDHRGVFLASPILFLSKFLKEGSVVISGDYHSSRFAGLYKFDEAMLTEIYKLADRCRIKNKIPNQNEATISKSTSVENNQTSEQSNKIRSSDEKTLTSELSELILKYGLKNIKEKINEIENLP